MKMKKIWCFVLAAVLLFTAFPAAYGGDVLAAGSFHAVYQNDFSQSLNVTLSDPYLTFVQGENFGAAEGKLTGSKDVWSALSYNTALAPAYAVSCDVSVGAIGGADITQSLVLGVRQSSPNIVFTGTGEGENQAGLYAFIKGSQIYIAEGARQYEGILIENLPVTFSDEITLRVEDTGSAVSYYATAGEEKTLLCRARFSPGAVAVENGEGETVGTISNSQVAEHGYANVMCHFADATLDNFTVETAPYEAGRVEEENGVRTTTYDFNTDKNTLMQDINLVSQQPNMLMENGKLVNHKSDNTWFDLCFTLPYGYASGYEVAMDISAAGADNWVQGYLLGVRLSEPYRVYLNGNALWAILNGDSICFTGPNSYNDTSNMVHVSNLPVNFQHETRFYIKDNIDNIEYYADADGVKTLLATAEIGESSVTIKNGAGTVAGTVRNLTLQKTGALNTMSHFAETTLDNVTFTVDAATVGGETPSYTTRDLYTDTWVATDDLGRKTPLYGDEGVPALKEDKKVGIFYFTWHTKEMDKNLTGDPEKGIYDHSKAYAEGGMDGLWEEMLQGPLGYGHYWAEPYFGYYRTDDEWIIRKHATMLANAGIDFLFVDASNNLFYMDEVNKIFDIYAQMRQEGLATPQFVFFCGDRADFADSDLRMAWGAFYRDQRYKDLWFMWEGKPLLFINTASITGWEEELSTFTIRRSWAFKDFAGDGINKWTWIDKTPQTPGRNSAGELEAMSVAVGFHANGSDGRSFHDGRQPTDGKKEFDFGLMETTTPLGLAFQEQWDEAMRVDPPVVLITGWNEWWAGRWENDAHGQTICSTYVCDRNDPVKKHYYVDNFNPEYSRDAEPMKGGFGDNYYYQMVSNIRKFKGARPVPKATGQKQIFFDKGGFSQWDSVSPEYRDTQFDIFHRNSTAAFDSSVRYVNTSGRNDISLAKVSKDTKNTYFYVETTSDLTQPESSDALWMNLYIDSDRSFQTGWCGYDYRINASREEGYCTVEKTAKDFSGYSQIGYAKYKMQDNKLMIWVPATLIPLGKAFEFKWADNSVSAGDPMQFMDQGDAAPDDRFNFLYLCDETLKDPEETKPSPSPSPSPTPTPKPTPTKTPPKGGGGGGGGWSGGGTKTTAPTKTPAATVTPGPTENPTESPAAASFSDLEGYAWASEAVYDLAGQGILKGTSADTFSPAANIKRGDFMLILTRALNLKATFTANFSDVLPTSYYYEAIGVCRQLGIAQGDGDLFRPEDPISRQDLVTLTYRALMNAGKLSESETGQDLSGFSDFEAISPYAKTPLAVLCEKGVITGRDGQIAPHDTATRAETAVICYRMLNLL